MADNLEDTLQAAVGVGLFFVGGPLAQLAGSALISDALAPDEPKGPEEGIEGALKNQNSNTAQIPVLYGTRRVGGTRVFLSTRGTDNKYLDMILVVCEGPIKGFRSVYANDAWLDFGSTVDYPEWRAGVLYTGGQSGDIRYSVSYNTNDIVFYNGSYWTADQFSYNETPVDGSAYWTETPLIAGTQTMFDDAGGSEDWFPNEYNKVYLQVDDVTGFVAGNYVAGQTSGATARIQSVDAGNDRLFITAEQNNVTTDRGFSIAETVEERTTRSGAPTGDTAIGQTVMRNIEPQYFKENVTYIVRGEVIPTDTSKLKKLSREYKDLIQLRFHNGATDQTADTVMTSAYSEWTTNHRLRGKAYIHARFEFDKDRMTGIPSLTALADGIEVYDPRDTNTKFESNPALCLRDYLTNTYYGRGIDPVALDDTSFIAAANYCDETLTITDTEYEGSPTGNTRYEGDRYNTHALVDTGSNIFSNIQQLLLPMRGFITYSNGLYKLLPDKETSSYHTFDERNIVGGVTINLGSKRNTFNEFRMTYPNPSKNWEPDDVVYFSDTIKTTLDNDLPLIKTATINTIANQHQALYIALQELKQSRQQITVSFKTGIEGLLVETGDVIRVRNLRYGWGTKTASIDGETVNVYNTRAAADIDYHEVYASGVLLGDDANPMYKEFKVLSVTLDDNLDVTVTALEYDPTVYTTAPASIEDESPDTNMTDTRVALPPKNIQGVEYLYVSKNASGFKAGIQLSWDTSDSAWDQSYEISVIEPFDAHEDGNAYSVGTTVYVGNIFYRCVTAVVVGTSNVPGVGPSITTTTSGSYYTVLTDGGETDWSSLFGAAANPVEVGQTYLATATSGDIDTTLGSTGATVRLTSWDTLTDAELVEAPKVLGVTEDREFNIRDAKEGYYIIQVRTINVVGKRSGPAEIAFEVEGLSAPPDKPTGVGIIVSNDNAIMTWNKSQDLDVLISGSIKIKHNIITDLSGLTSDAALEALWQNSSTLTEGKSGSTTQVFLPLIVGTYLVKFIDAAGVQSTSPAYVINNIAPSAAVTLVTSFSELDDFTTASFDGLTDDADTRTGFDTVGLEKITHDSVDKLQFDTTGNTFADTPLVTSATYYLHNPIYFDTLVDAEFDVTVLMDTYNINNLVSGWTDIDSLTSIDDTALTANVVTQISITTDDPTDPLAVWSEYFTFLTGSVKCMGARAAVSITVNTTDTQILIKDIIFSFSGKERVEVVNDLTWTTGDYTAGYKDVYYANPFFNGAGIAGADPVVPILNITLNSSIPGATVVTSNGTQEYAGGPGTGGPTPETGFRLMVSTFSALNTTTSLLNSNVDFGYQAIGY